jgi:5-methylcytosine-specific restriction endonuclease McrA
MTRPWIAWYKTTAWKRLRLSHLSREPLCRFCKKKGIVTPANTVDHIEPHRGNMEKFFGGPFQSLCKHCHSSIKQKYEKSG